jgi:hypothetical protein
MAIQPGLKVGRCDFLALLADGVGSEADRNDYNVGSLSELPWSVGPGDLDVVRADHAGARHPRLKSVPEQPRWVSSRPTPCVRT